jgi:hypothetical protein
MLQVYSSTITGLSQHGPLSDFSTYTLTLDVRMYAEIVMQAGLDIATFTDVATTEDAKLRILHAAFVVLVDKPTMITMPVNAMPIPMASIVVICAMVDRVPHVVALVNSTSETVRQPWGTDFAIGHVTVSGTMDAAFVFQSVPMMVLDQPMTWSETLALPRALDTVYGLNTTTRSELSSKLCDILATVYIGIESPVGPVRIFLQRSHHAAYSAARIRRLTLVDDFLRTGNASLVPFVRAMMLARMMEWGTTTSSSATFKTYYFIATTGVPVFVPCGQAVHVDTSYEAFANRMLNNFACRVVD